MLGLGLKDGARDSITVKSTCIPRGVVGLLGYCRNVLMCITVVEQVIVHISNIPQYETKYLDCSPVVMS